MIHKSTSTKGMAIHQENRSAQIDISYKTDNPKRFFNSSSLTLRFLSFCIFFLVLLSNNQLYAQWQIDLHVLTTDPYYLTITSTTTHCNVVPINVTLHSNKKFNQAVNTSSFTIFYTDPVTGPQTKVFTLADLYDDNNYHFTIPGNSGIYTLTALHDGDGTSLLPLQDINVTVNIYPTPTLAITPDPAYVGVGSNLTLTASPGGGLAPYTGYSWSGHASVNGTTTQTATFNSASSGSYLISSTVTDSHSCTATDNLTVTVSNLSASIVPTPNPATICLGNTVSLNAQPTGGSGSYSHAWSYGSAGGGTGSYSSNTAEDPTFTPNNSDTYTLTYTVTDLITSAIASANVTVTVNPKPATKTVNKTNYCFGATGGTITVISCDLNTSYTLINNTTSTTISTQTVLVAGTNITWSNLTQANYYVQVTDQITSCSVNLPLVTITENSLPVVAPTIDDNPVCSGSTSILHANAPTAVAWLWNNAASITGSNTVANPIASPTVFTNYTVTVTDVNGCQNSGSRSVNVTATPTININDDQGNTFTICEADNIILTGTSTKTIATWAWSNGAATPSTTVTPGTTTTYTLMVTDVDGCTNSKSQVVTVNDRPTANAGSDVVMCFGIGITLTATATDGDGSYSYLWSGGTTPANQSTTVNPANDATYSVTVTDGNGCFHSDAVFVDVVVNPTVSVAAAPGFDLAICHGESTDLLATPASGTAPYTYNWPHSGASSQTVTVSPPNPVFNATPVLTNYSVTVTDVNGCHATSSVNVTTNSLTAITIANDLQSYCQDAGIVNLVGTPAGGTWSDISTPGFIILPNTFDPAPPTTPTSYTVQYDYTNTNGCLNTLQATVTILPYSTPTVSITNPLNGETFCNIGAPIEAITTTDDIGVLPGVTRTITSASAGVTDLGGGTGTFNPTLAGIGSHTITYTVTTPGCNNGTSVTVDVGNPVNITPLNDMCVGVADQVLGVDVGGGTWHITFTPSSTGIPNPTISYPEGDPLAKLQATVAGHYDVGYELTVASCSNTTNVSCDVYDLPVLDFNIGTYNQSDLGINFCDNIAPVLLTPTLGGGSFSSLPAGNVNTSWFEPTTVGAGTYKLIYSLTDANGCFNSVTSQNITVSAAPVVDITDLNATYCKDAATFTITGDPTSGTLGFGTFTFPTAWVSGLEYTDNGDGTATINPANINTTGSYSITYAVADLNGCTGTKTETFTVNKLPTVDFNGFPAIVAPALTSQICRNAVPITLTGSPTTNTGVFTGDGITDNGNGTASFNPSAQTVGNHNITYTWTDPVTTCVNSITKTIEILPLPLTFAVTAPSGLNYCSSGAGITIGVSASEGATNTYYLMQNGTTQMDMQNGTGASFPFVGSYNAANYTVIAENAYGCRLPYGNTVIPIEFPAIGDAGSITGNAAVCADGVTVYNYSVPVIANATDHIWTIPAVGVTISADNDDNIDVIFDNTFVGGNISVYGNDPASVCPAGNSNFITVAPNPEPTTGVATISSSSGIFVVCEGTNGLVYSTNDVDFSNETSFEWEIAAGTAVITSTTTTSSITVNYLVGSTNGYVRVRGVNACGVSPWVTHAITVNPIPNVSINALGAGDVITCAASSQVHLNAATTEVLVPAWTWTASGGGVIVSGDEHEIDPFVSHEGNYQVQIGITTNALECFNTASIVVGADKTAPVATINPHGVLDCNNITLTLQANSTTPSSYLWTFTPPANITNALPHTMSNPTVDQPGAYTVTVTDLSNSCTGSTSTLVTRNTTAPNITVTTPAAAQLTCLVNSVNVTGNSTTGGATYQWSTAIVGATITNPTNATATVDMAGVYNLQVTDPANGCTASLPVTVNVNRNIPIITLLSNTDGQPLTCSNPTVQLQAAVAAVPTATFVWNTLTGTIDATSGAYLQFAEVSEAADYTVVATDPANGCQSIVHTINVTEDLSTATTTGITSLGTELTCTNSSTLNLAAVITGDAGIGTYLWSGTGTLIAPLNTNSVNVTSAGTYTLTYGHSVTGCTTTANIVVTNKTALPTVSINPGPYVVTCSNVSATSAITPTITATGDANPLTTYLWTGPAGAVISNPTSVVTTVDRIGTYVITATNPYGCVSSANVTVTSSVTPPNISVTTPAASQLTCLVNAVPVTGASTTPGATYLWTPDPATIGATISTPNNFTTNVDKAGVYWLKVTNPSNGCTSSLPVTVTENRTVPTITALVNNDVPNTNITCSNTSVQLQATASAANATFVWNTLTGTIDATSGAYLQFAEVSEAADYTVVATDPANGCQSIVHTINVTEDLSTATTTGITSLGTELTCTNSGTLNLAAVITGDAGIGTYLWSGTGTLVAPLNTNSVNVTSAGTFTLTYGHSVTGCTTTANIVVTNKTALPTVSINPGPYVVTCANVSATSAITPTITATGDANLLTTYLWTGPAVVISNPTSLVTTVDRPGTYVITATNPYGCVNSANITVTSSITAPNISVTTPAASQLTCLVNAVPVTGASTTPGATYLWTPDPATIGATISTPNNFTTNVDKAGVYWLKVTNPSNGCTSSLPVTVTENRTVPTITALVNNDVPNTNITCSNTSVQLQATVSSVSDAFFSWSPGTGLNSGAYNQFNEVSAAGIYTATATHPISGCTDTETITVVTDSSIPVINIVADATTITCTKPTIILNGSTSIDATNFAWTYSAGGNITSGGTTNTATISTGATYTLTAVHTTTGCSASASVVIAENKALPSVTITGAPYTLTCSNPTLVLSAVADAGSSIGWTGPGIIADGNTLSPTINLNGNYRITATAANGCSSYADVAVGIDKVVPDISVNQNPFDITCTRTSVSISGLSMVAGVSYSWQKLSGSAIITNPTNPTATVNAAGDFRLTVTAPNGCTNSGDVTVGDDLILPNLTLPAIDDNEITCIQTTVLLNGSSSTSGVLYSWSTLVSGATILNGGSPTPTVNKTGDYSVVVTNPINGCTTSGTTTVNGTFTTPAIVIAAPSGQITCATPTITLDATGTTNASTYQWVASNGGHILSGATTTQPVVDAAGRYTLTANHTTTGCPSTLFVDVTSDGSLPAIDIFDPFPAVLTCSTISATLLADASSLTTNKSILWTTTDGHITSADTITNPTVDKLGTYTVKITNTTTGCYTIRGVTVAQNITPPTIQIDNPLNLTCSRLQVSITSSATSVDASPLTYSWTAGAGGSIVSGSTTTNPAVDAAANYNLTVTDLGNGCVNTSSVTVTQDVTLPGVSVDTNPNPITCYSSMVQLNGSSSYTNVSYQWTTTGTGTILNATTQTPMVDAIGTYNLTVTNLDNGCTRTSADVIVTDDVTPPSVTVSAPSGDITCSVAVVTLSASYDAGYTYTWSGPGTIGSPNSYTTTVNAAGAFTLLVKGNSSGCETTYTLNVAEDVSTTTPPIIDNTIICFGVANPPFTVTIGSNVRWYADASLNTFLGSGNSYTPTATTAGIHPYYATSTGSNGCVSLPTEITLTINALPNAPLTFGNSICEGSAAKPISAVGSNIKWYNSSYGFIASGSTYIPTVTIAGIYTYYATQTDINGCESGYKSTTYTINQVPLAPAFVDATLDVCESETNPIFTVTGASIKWYRNMAGAVISTGNTYQPVDLLPGIYTYYTTQTTNQCESAYETGVLTINPLPTKYSVTGGGVYCESGSGKVVGLENSQTGVHYELWLDGSTLVSDLPGTTGLPISFGNQLAAGTYTIKAITTSGCSTMMNGSTTIAINPLPGSPSIINGPASVCQGETVVFSVDPIANATSYQWSIPAGMLLVSGSTVNSITVNVTTSAASGNISVFGVNSCGDGPLSASKLVAVGNLPSAPTGVISGGTAICEGQGNVTYTIAPITNAISYEWTLLPGMTIIEGANTNTIVVQFSINESGGNIYVQGQNGCGLGPKSSDLAITIKPLPSPLAIPDINVCATTTPITTSSLETGESGVWSVIYGPATVFPSTSTSSTVSNLRMGLNTLVWTLTNSGCSATDTVNIFNNITAVNAGIDQVICSTSTNLEAIYPTTGATWTVIPPGSGEISDASSPTSLVNTLSQDDNKFVWQVNNSGCVSRDTVTIFNYKPYYPNAGIDQIVDINSATLEGSDTEIGTIGFWSLISGSGTFVDIYDPKTQVTGLLSGINKLVWSVIRESCVLTDTMIIDNIQIEDPDAGLNQTLCVNYTELNAKYPPIGTGEWSVVSGAATFADKYSNTTKITNIGHGNNSLRWTVRTSGLGMEYDDVLIVNNETSIANAGTNLVICTDAVNLSANNPVYGTGAWTLISGSGNIANINDPSSLVSNLGQGKNDLKWTITNLSCISEAFVSITNNTPSTANAGLDQTICFDTTILYPNTPSIGVGSWSLISGSGTFSGNVVKNLAPNQNTLRYTITQGTCKSTDDVLITNDNPTTPSAGYDQSLCINTAVLNGNPITQGNGLWSIISGSGSFSSLVVNNPTVTGIADGINIYRWTVTKNGCSEQDEVIVSNNFVLATAGEDVVLCVDNTQLNASNPLPGIGTWSVVGNSGATFDNQNSPNSMVRNLSKGDNTFRWTVTNVGCVSFDEVQVTNNQPTQALAGENQSVCSKTAILNANQALFGTGVWSAISGSATFADQNSNQTTVSNLAGGPNVLRWTISKGFCLSYDEVIITSNLPVNVFAGNDQIACSSVAVLSANPPSNGTGQWSIITGAGSFVNRTLYNTAVTNLGQGENVFKWTVSNSDCHISDTVTIKSSIPSTSIAGSSQIICSETTTLGGNTPLSGTGSWSVVSGSVEFTDRSLPNTTIKNIARGLNILAWIIDKDGCQSSSELTITNNLPSTPFAGYDIHICGDSIRLFADPPSIGTGVWSLVSGDAAILNNTLNQTRVINIKFGDNTFRWKLTNKNCMLYDDVIITSDYAYANAGADREVNTSTIQLIGNVPAAGTGTWSLSAGQASILNPNQFDTWVNNLGSGANIFTWNINNNGCIASDEVTINYIVMPIADFTPSTIEGCSPFSVNFVNTSIGGIPYSWNFGDGTVSNETNIVHTYNSPGTYKVILTATGPLGLTVKKEGTVIVNGHPKAVFDIAPKVIYIPGQRISCFNYSLYAKTSIWDFGDGNTITELAPRYAYSDTGRFDITLKVLNTFNCADSITLLDIVHVKKRSELFFPEAFTPNPVGGSGGTFDPQDRSNDVFYPIIIDGEITDYELKVYNRSGVLVFKSNDIKIGWDGYYKNKLLPQDVYIYMVSGRYNSNEAFQEVHNVLLIKKDN